MNTTGKWLLLLLTGFSPTAFAGLAGGQLVYGANASAPSVIPTLGGATLVILGLLLAVVAFRAIKTNGHQLMSIGLVALAITASYSGVELVSEAKALDVTFPLNNPAGGSVVYSASNYNIFNNTTTIMLQVLSVTPEPSFCDTYPTGNTFPEGPECAAGLGLAAGESCVIDCTGGGEGE
ncbi:MAG: midcut-by-XrtH protein [Xanthomonadales bacterium]|nr:midcut-by-XrtH protein [Xanthomonadales bacterium]